MTEKATTPTGKIVSELRWGVLTATLWANPTQNGETLSVTLRRGYQHPPGEWKEVKMSVPREQLLSVSELLREMHHRGWEYLNSVPKTVPAEDSDAQDGAGEGRIR